LPGRKNAGEFIAIEWIFRRVKLPGGVFVPVIVQSSSSAVCCADCMSEFGSRLEKYSKRKLWPLKKIDEFPPSVQHQWVWPTPTSTLPNPPENHPFGLHRWVWKLRTRHIKRHFVLTFPLGCLLQPQKKIKTRNEKKKNFRKEARERL